MKRLWDTVQIVFWSLYIASSVLVALWWLAERWLR